MDQNADAIAKAIKGSLNIIEQDREKEIISRRFGLNGQKETLEQIGDMLSITRERVRQLEKAILIRLRVCSEEGEIADLAAAEKIIIRNSMMICSFISNRMSPYYDSEVFATLMRNLPPACRLKQTDGHLKRVTHEITSLGTALAVLRKLR